MRYLVFGADGYIGSYLYGRLREDIYEVIGTSRIARINNGYIKFDILKDDAQKIVTIQKGEGKGIAIFCIAQSNIDKCYEDYRNAYTINVIKTKEIFKILCDYNYKIIFFSTDNVFDGRGENYSETSITNPLNDYGKMKEEMEKYLTKEIRNSCILRLPKVLDSRRNEGNLLSGLDRIKDGQTYKCIQGNIMSFLAMKDLYNILLTVINDDLTGIFHVCSDERISRKKLVEKFYSILHRDKVRIIECGINDIPFMEKRRPLNVGMSNKKIKDITGYKFLSIEEIIEDYLDETKN